MQLLLCVFVLIFPLIVLGDETVCSQCGVLLSGSDTELIKRKSIDRCLCRGCIPINEFRKVIVSEVLCFFCEWERSRSKGNQAALFGSAGLNILKGDEESALDSCDIDFLLNSVKAANELIVKLNQHLQKLVYAQALFYDKKEEYVKTRLVTNCQEVGKKADNPEMSPQLGMVTVFKDDKPWVTVDVVVKAGSMNIVDFGDGLILQRLELISKQYVVPVLTFYGYIILDRITLIQELLLIRKRGNNVSQNEEKYMRRTVRKIGKNMECYYERHELYKDLSDKYEEVFSFVKTIDDKNKFGCLLRRLFCFFTQCQSLSANRIPTVSESLSVLNELSELVFIEVKKKRETRQGGWDMVLLTLGRGLIICQGASALQLIIKNKEVPKDTIIGAVEHVIEFVENVDIKVLIKQYNKSSSMRQCVVDNDPEWNSILHDFIKRVGSKDTEEKLLIDMLLLVNPVNYDGCDNDFFCKTCALFVKVLNLLEEKSYLENDSLFFLIAFQVMIHLERMGNYDKAEGLFAAFMKILKPNSFKKKGVDRVQEVNLFLATKETLDFLLNP